jgi:hypothetical protein
MIVNTLRNFSKTNNDHKQKPRHMTYDCESKSIGSVAPLLALNLYQEN